MSVKIYAPPPGVWKNGTRYQARGRYYETNLVRWHDGALRPIGGWNRRQDAVGADLPPLVDDPLTEVVRDALAWRTNQKEGLAAFGSNTSLYRFLLSGDVLDITPAGLPAGNRQPETLEGYGTGFYGRLAYGAPPRAVGDTSNEPAGRWTLDNWGENLLACPDWDGGLYEWVPGTASAVPVLNAPDDIISFVVTDERIVMTIGSATEARVVRWSDSENNTIWTPTVQNLAGSYVLPGSGSLISIHRVQRVNLILSETDAYAAEFVKPPYVFSFRKIGEACAPVDRKSVAVTERMAVWIGERNLWMFDGGSITPLQCDLIDFFYEDADNERWSQITAWIHPDFSEIWWQYVSTGSDDGEPDSYIAYDWNEGHWAHGRLRRTLGLSAPMLDEDIMITPEGEIINHELTGTAQGDGSEGVPYALTGPLRTNPDGANLVIRRLFPDTSEVGDVDIAFETRQMPTGEVRRFGPYQYRNPTPVKVLGRDVMMEVRGNGTSYRWEIGDWRADVSDNGTGSR